MATKPKPIYMNAKIKQAFQTGYWPKTDKEICWPWIGHTDPNGRGHLVAMEDDKSHNYVATRISYMLFHNLDYLGEEYVLHTCHSIICVNPHHLYLGDHAQNMRDMVAAGRQARDENNGGAKLTREQVYEIKKMLHQGYRVMTISNKFDVDKTTIYDIKNGQRWISVKYDPYENM